MYAGVSVRKTVSLSEVAMSHDGPARPAALTPQLLSNVHQVTNVLQNPETTVPSTSTTSVTPSPTPSFSETSQSNFEVRRFIYWVLYFLAALKFVCRIGRNS